MLNRSLSSFVPAVYKDIIEMDDIIQSEEKVMDIARTEMFSAFANTFILTSDESGVIMFEKMLNITANSQVENLEFRRQRVLNRMSTNIPFTFRFLKQKLNEIIGVDAWRAYVDFANYTLHIEACASDKNWYSELSFTVNRMKPCNMVFVHVPYTPARITVTEEVAYRASQWMYRLGSWKLGRDPFLSIKEGGVAQMPELRSVRPALINDTANFVVSDISYVLINDSVKITTFTTKKATEGVVTLEYEVTPSQTSIITDIKLMKADNTVLTQATVYVPVAHSVVSKHTITVKEGA